MQTVISSTLLLPLRGQEMGCFPACTGGETIVNIDLPSYNGHRGIWKDGDFKHQPGKNRN